MRSEAALLLATIALAGCTPVEMRGEHGPAARHICRNEPAQHYLGHGGGAGAIEGARRASGAKSVRVVRPGEAADIKSLAGRMSQLLDPSMHWGDVDDLRKLWTGPLILKGILHPDEAKMAVTRGVDALIVSNHGGRQLDGAAAGLDALPAIIDAVGGRIPVLVDGGIRRGTDVMKALALGAKACLIGRPQLWGVAVAGEAGVARVLEIFAQEIERAMGLCGVTRTDQIDDSLLLKQRIGQAR